MKKSVIKVATVAVVGLSSAFFVNTVSADTPSTQSEIKSEREEVKSKLSKAESEIADVLFDLKEINEEMKKVEGALKENEALQKETETNISNNEKEISKLEKEIAVIQKRIDERTYILKDRMVAYQQNGGDIAYLEVLLGAKSFNEFLSNASAVSKITNADINLVQEQENDKNKVEESQVKVEEKLAEQKEKQAELKEMVGIIKEQKESTSKSKDKLKKKEKELTNLKANLESEDSTLAALEADIRQGSGTATASASSNDNGNLSTLGSSSSKKSSNGGGGSAVSSGGGSGMGAVIGAGNRFIGNSTYVFGAADPSNGRFDCSGFVNWAFGQGGYSVPRTTGALASAGKAVSPSDMQPGDLVFFNTNGHNGHVGIYIGGGQFIGSQSSTGVAIANMNSGYWAGQFSGTVRRVN
ncbi:MAG TPA: NlpC/P60 family protein [Bacillota bacterium]|nr:NlpC/P60 family protein [Bacillota bacterium]